MQIIGGLYKSRLLVAPKGDQTRPSKNMLRETLFNICAPFIDDALFVDLFAGSGAIGLEAISRGARQVYFVESHKNAIDAIEKNIGSLKVEKQTAILKGDVFKNLAKVSEKIDIIFADPPYSKDPKESLALKLLAYLEKHEVLKSEGIFFLETHKSEKIDLNLFPSFELLKQKFFGDSQLLMLKYKKS